MVTRNYDSLLSKEQTDSVCVGGGGKFASFYNYLNKDMNSPGVVCWEK